MLALLAVRVTAARTIRDEAAERRDAARQAFYGVSPDEGDAALDDAHLAWLAAREVHDTARDAYTKALEEQNRALAGIVGNDIAEQLESLRQLVGGTVRC